jgi:hypothetical protein
MCPLPSSDFAPPPDSAPVENTTWRELYSAAILELNRTQIAPRIAQAEKVIIERARELFDEDGVNSDERQALDDALYFLRALRNTLVFETFSSPNVGDDGGRKVA